MHGFSLPAARRFGQKVGQLGHFVLAGAMLGHASFTTKAATLTKRERNFWSLFFVLAASLNQVFAQTGSVTSVNTASTTIKSVVFTVAQAIFAVFLVVALVKVAKKFMNGEPDAVTSFFWLLGGLIIFFGFSAFKQSLVGTGAAGGGTADGLIGQ